MAFLWWFGITGELENGVGENLQEPFMETVVGGDDFAIGHHVVAAVEIAGETSGFADQHDSGGHVPSMEPDLPKPFVPAGGHNVLEPAAWGKPVVFGPHMENFAEIAELFLTNRAACQIPSADALEPALSTLLGDPVQRAALGAAARALVEANRGATDRTLTAMAALLPPAAGAPAGVVVPFGAG